MACGLQVKNSVFLNLNESLLDIYYISFKNPSFLEKKLSDVSCKVYDTSAISLPVFQSTSRPVKEIQRIKYSFALIYSQKKRNLVST